MPRPHTAFSHLPRHPGPGSGWGPYLGAKRLDKLSVRDVREWLTKLATVCQCCAQGKDAKRAPTRRKCCAVGDCCESYPSRRVIQGSREALRAALTHVASEEEINKNVASLVKVPKPRRRRIKPWSVAEAGQFLTDATARDDHLFAAWMLMLSLGLRRGEVLGLTRESLDFEVGELYVDHQIQRAGRQILHRETKTEDTEDSDDFLPLPALCLKALRMRRAQQLGDRKAAGELWQDSHDLVFTTKAGTPIEPGNPTRMFALRARRAGLRVIPLRNTRHTCSSLLVALKVHPKVAQRILRHSQIAMTMEVYAEASEEAVRAAIGKLSDAMGETG
ncbi:site-specific integrase [Streptomyces sp. NBC_01142]|uniref:tyrosine-type recombinase/integrase n=1 Tax=Streptomyces sp. NBC_01142 TaxID=2975865 RepID=UPI00225A9136|nr:site-specific integrase [Streptomyces sp. NBC_01142]MCX4824208.1 site-specific integrase [Streptomyces sp. NBC_01142]